MPCSPMRWCAIEAALELAVARGFRENKHETPNKKYRCEEEGEASPPTVSFRPEMARRGAPMRGGGINPRRDPNTRKTMVRARISWLGYERGSTELIGGIYRDREDQIPSKSGLAVTGVESGSAAC